MANGYRRGSIFWALTLIAIGALFLYTNFHHDVRPWHIVAKYWPVLIIFWGLSKLYGYFKFRKDPNVPIGPFITGGEIVGLIFLLLLGTAISNIVSHTNRVFWGPGIHIDDENINLDGLFGSPYDFTEQVEAAAKTKATIQIPDVNGDLKVIGWDQPKIRVVIKKRIHAGDENEAKQQAVLLKTTITETGSQYIIATNRQEVANKGYRVQTDLEVQVPKDSQVTTDQRRGSVALQGLAGDQTIESARGDVTISQIAGNATVKMQRGDLKANDVSGNVEVSGRGGEITIAKVGGAATVNGEFYTVDFEDVKKQAHFVSSRTDLMAERVEGGIRLESGDLRAHNVKGQFVIKTKEKDIKLEDVAGPIRVDNSRGDFQYRSVTPPKSDIEVQTQSASIELDVPANTSFRIDGKTKSGDIQSGFTAPTLKISKDLPVNEITGFVGKGGPHFRLETTYGDVKLVQH